MEFIIAKPRIFWRHKWISAFVGLLLLWGGTAQPCPPMCQFCSADRTECEQVSSLQAVLIGLPAFTEKIVLRHGNFSEIPPLSFHKFPNLHFLSITGFPVSSLTDLTFSPDHANSLRSLNLSNNHLLSCSIHPMTFSNLVTLEELALNNNSLEILQSPWFLGLMALSKLSLALNKISYLPPRMFENLARLQVLVIASNQIQYLSMDTFSGLVSLIRLDLSNNKIQFISNEAFQPLQVLRYLLLFDNKLTALPGFPSSITFLLLHSNPWDCTCQLLDFVESWGDRIQESALMVCNAPPSLAGYQVINAKLEACSPSASNPDLPPVAILNLRLLFGFLGGLLVGLIIYPLLCCCLKLCKCPSVLGQAEIKKSFPSKSTGVFLGKATTTRAEPEFLGNFPVIENTMIGFEVGNLAKRSCAHLHETSRTYNMEQIRSRAGRPLVALLSVDKVTNKTVVMLCEKGNETGASRDEWIHSPNQLPKFLGDAEQRCMAHGELKFCGSPFHHATPNQTERTECEYQIHRCWHCMFWVELPFAEHAVNLWILNTDQLFEKEDGAVSYLSRSTLNSRMVYSMGLTPRKVSSGLHFFPGMGWDVDSRLDGQTSKSDAVQPPQTSTHEDFPAGNTTKIQSAVGREISFQRDKSSGSGHHINASHSQSEMEGKASSPGHCYCPGFASPSYAETSERRRWQEESFMERSNLRNRARSRDLSWRAGIDSKAYCLRLSRSSRKLLRNLRHIPYYETTSASALSSSSSSCSVALRPRKCTGFSLYLSATPQRRKMSLKHKKVRRQRTDLNVAMARGVSTVEKIWKCPKCSCEKSQPCSVAQLEDAVSSKGLKGVASQPLSFNIASLKDHKIAQTLLVPHQNTESFLAEDFLESTLSPRPHLPFGISHGGPNEVEEPTDEYPQLSYTKSTPGTELSQQASGMDFPVAEKTVTQVILKEEDGVGMVHTITAVDSMIVHSIKHTNVRSLGEEMYNAQVQVEAFAHAFDQCLAGQEKVHMNTSSDITQLNSCLVDRSSSETGFSGPEEPKLQEATNIISSYPLVQRMFQIDFPLSNEE